MFINTNGRDDKMLHWLLTNFYSKMHQLICLSYFSLNFTNLVKNYITYLSVFSSPDCTSIFLGLVTCCMTIVVVSRLTNVSVSINARSLNYQTGTFNDNAIDVIDYVIQNSLYLTNQVSYVRFAVQSFQSKHT